MRKAVEPTGLRILHLDDSSLDAELIREKLADFDPSPFIDWAANEAEYRQFLQESQYDLILADYHLPGFEAPAALRMARGMYPDIPFICISGAIGEERAVELLKIGATDYVLKSRLDKLPFALRRALTEITEHRTRELAEETLRENKEQHRDILQTAMDGFWMTDVGGRLLEANATYARMSGYSMEELLTLSIADLDAEEATDEIGSHIRNLIRHGEQRFETRHRRKDGSLFDVEVSAQYRANRGGQIICFIQDISERKQARQKTMDALQEKETLIRELFHRTRNTMQVIRGILLLQADEFPDNPQLQQLVKCTETRIQVISLVHQQLYSTQDLSHLSIRTYIHELSALILASFGLPPEQVSLDLRIEDCNFLLDTAIPVGLILHELITNSLTHAFADSRSGTISIKLDKDERGTITLRYADNGVGAPPGFDFRKQTTLGMKLIFGIAEQQLAGKVEMGKGQGFSCLITFRTNLYKARV